MRLLACNSRWVLLLLLVLAGFAVAGCSSTDPENMSQRPWSSPQSWETGLPSGMFDQQR